MIEGLLQPTHLLVILAVAIFVFGPKKIPSSARVWPRESEAFRTASSPPLRRTIPTNPSN
jgi:Sec-independent protein translocase protein TatA